MKLKKRPKTKGGGYVLTYKKSELKHKDYLIDKMIAVGEI